MSLHLCPNIRSSRAKAVAQGHGRCRGGGSGGGAPGMGRGLTWSPSAGVSLGGLPAGWPWGPTPGFLKERPFLELRMQSSPLLLFCFLKDNQHFKFVLFSYFTAIPIRPGDGAHVNALISQPPGARPSPVPREDATCEPGRRLSSPAPWPQTSAPERRGAGVCGVGFQPLRCTATSPGPTH